MHKWNQIQAMKKQGLGVKKIARTLKLSKNTVRKYLISGEPPNFHKKPVPKKITPYVEQVEKMRSQGYLGTRIQRELKALGFSGGVAIVRRCIRELEREKRKKKLSTTRVETAPGEQMQYDWKEWMLSIGGVSLKIYLHAVVLSYSRKKFYMASQSITEQDVIRAIESALFFFGGAAREIVIDNPKQLVIAHRKDGVIRFNEGFLKFCGLYGINPYPCQPYWPQTKGKVERPFFFLQEQLLRGLEVDGWEAFDGKLLDFNNEYNQQSHPALGESPEIRFVRDEQSVLLPVSPVDPALLYPRERRRVSSDGYLHYRRGSYPMPMKHCLDEVWVESVMGRTFRVYANDGTLIAELVRHWPEDGRRPVHPEHEVINEEYRRKRLEREASVSRRFVAMFGTTGERYLAGLRERVKANYRWHLHEIMQYGLLYAPEEIQAAMATCLEASLYHKNSVRQLLDPRNLKAPAAPSRDIVWPITDLSRPLSAYAELLEVPHG